MLSGIILALSLGQATPARSAGCFSAPYNCFPRGDINPATPSNNAAQELAWALFAWNDFLSLNFPAAQSGTTYLPTPSTTNGLDHGAGNYTTVWQTWPEARDIFLPMGAAPPAFGANHVKPAACPSSPQVVGNGMVLDEYYQADHMGPVIDKNGQYVRFGMNFNKPMYDYVVTNTLYTAEGQAAFDTNPNHSLDIVNWPRGAYNGGAPDTQGSIFVKTAWKVLGAGDDPQRFFKAYAYSYTEKGGPFPFFDQPTIEADSCSVVLLGLVGMHIVHRSNSTPQWSWATFEHVQNGPWLHDFADGTPAGPYSFFTPATCTSSGGAPSCAYNTPPANPWNPNVVSPTRASQLVRVGAPGPMAEIANQAMIAQLTAAYGPTVWNNYFLVDIQFPTKVRITNPATGFAVPNPADPDGIPSPGFLPNSTVENPIQGFPEFPAAFATTNGFPVPRWDRMLNVPLLPPVNPFALSVWSITGGASRVTSTCVGCHQDATMTSGAQAGNVYALSRAQKTH